MKEKKCHISCKDARHLSRQIRKKSKQKTLNQRKTEKLDLKSQLNVVGLRACKDCSCDLR